MGLKSVLNEMTLEPSMEAINFQYDSKAAKKLLDIFKKLKKEGFTPKNIEAFNTAKVISDLCGLTVKFLPDDNITDNAYVLFPKHSRNHPFYQQWQKPYVRETDLKKALRTEKVCGYKIDMQTGRISGKVTEYKHEIRLAGNMLHEESRYTAEEALAIFLHEVGHLMSYYEWAYRQSTTNLLLSEFTAAFMEAKPDERITVITEAKNQGLLKKAERDLMKAKSADEVRAIIYNSEIESSRSDLGTNVYDVRTWETLADQYVTRLGYGSSLYGAMKKLSGRYNTTRTKYWLGLVKETFIFTCAAGTLVGFATMAAFPPTVAGLAIGYFLGMVLNEEYIEAVYDKPQQRLKVIRQEVIHRLKAAPNTETKKAVLAELDLLDNLGKVGPEAFSMAMFIHKTLFPKGRSRYRSLRTQQLLESLAASELNVSLARLEA